MRNLVVVLLLCVCVISSTDAATLADLRGDFQLAPDGQTSSDLGIVDTVGDGAWNYYSSSQKYIDTPGAEAILMVAGIAGNDANSYGGGLWENAPAISSQRLWNKNEWHSNVQPDADEVSMFPMALKRPYAIARWRAGANSAGLVRVSGSFRNMFEWPTADFTVLHNGVVKGYLSPAQAKKTEAWGDGNARTPFSFDAQITAGDTIDFVMGYWDVASNGWLNNGTDEGYASAKIETLPGTIAILAQPEDALVMDDGDALFLVDAAGASLTYQWVYDPDGTGVSAVNLSDNADYSGSTTSQLTVVAVDVSDEGMYYCVVTDASGSVDTQKAGLAKARMTYSWAFDGDLIEAGASGFDGVGGIIGTANGVDGNGAVYLDGTGSVDFGNVPMTSESFRSGFSLSYWVKPDNSFDPYNHDFKAHVSKQMGDWEPWGTYCFIAGGAENLATMNVNIWGSGWFVNHQDLNGAAMANVFTPDQWSHVVVAVDNDTLKIYIDGQLKHWRDMYAKYQDFKVPLSLGVNRFTENDTYFLGTIDDLKLYNYAITAKNVEVLYANMLGLPICEVDLEGDINGDCAVDLNDLAIMAAQWLN